MVPTQPFRGRLDPLECGEVCVDTPCQTALNFRQAFLLPADGTRCYKTVWACCEVRCFEEWMLVMDGDLDLHRVHASTHRREMGLREELFLFLLFRAKDRMIGPLKATSPGEDRLWKLP